MEYCCSNCFAHEYLHRIIDTKGSIDNCNFCGAENTKCIEPKEIAEEFLPIVSLYKAVEDFMPLHDLKRHDGEMLYEKLQSDWGIFTNDEFSDRLTAAIFPDDPHDCYSNPLLHSYVAREDNYWGTDAEYTADLEAAWIDFCDEITYRNRYFPRSSFNIEQLSTLLPILEDTVPTGKHFYRARNSFSGPLFGVGEIGKPPANKSKFGRANPTGISYLYLTADPYTAVREVRPSLDDKISIGLFLTTKPIKVVDLTRLLIKCPFSLGSRLEEAVQSLGFLRKLGDEVSKPIDPTAAELEYVPLQYLCEYFKNCGYDGIRFNSSLTTGVNTTLFNDDAVKCIETSLYRIETEPVKISP